MKKIKKLEDLQLCKLSRAEEKLVHGAFRDDMVVCTSENGDYTIGHDENGNSVCVDDGGSSTGPGGGNSGGSGGGSR